MTPSPSWNDGLSADLLRIIQSIATRRNTTTKAIMGRTQSRSVSIARWEVIHALNARGLSAPEIGRILHRHHTSIYRILMLHRRPYPNATKPITEPELLNDSLVSETDLWSI